MTDRPGWGVTTARAIALGLTLALAPLPLAAAEAGHVAPANTLATAIAKAAATERLASSRTALAQTAQTAGAAAPDSRRFFKTPVGMAVIAIVGAGTAYAVYSAQHDRIHSAVR